MDEILLLKEAATQLRVSQRHLERLIHKGDGPPLVALGTRRVGIRFADLKKWVDDRTEPMPKPRIRVPAIMRPVFEGTEK